MPHPLIVSGFEELLYHDGPVLYSGLNRFGDYVIGLTVDEDDDAGIVRSFHVVVQKSQYAGFVTGRISLRQLYREAPPLFVVDQPYGSDEVQIYPIDHSEVPEEYLPLESALCPRRDIVGSFEFATALEGSLANEHLIIPHVLATSALNWTPIIEEPFRLQSELVNPRARITTMVPSSFAINYVIKFDYIQHTLFSRERVGNIAPEGFASNYLHYVMNHLSDDVIMLLPGRDISGKYLSDLMHDYLSIAVSHNIEYAQEGLIASLRRALSHLGKVSGLIGEGFNAVTLASERSGQSHFIGSIGERDAAKIKQSSLVVSEAMQAAVDRADDVPHDYRIVVTHLNKETGMCEARVVLERNSGERAFPKAKVILPDDLELTLSKFTRSLHEDAEIIVRGIGSWKDDALKTISVVE